MPADAKRAYDAAAEAYHEHVLRCDGCTLHGPTRCETGEALLLAENEAWTVYRAGQGGGGTPVQVTIHGKYGRGPMPVEFRDALAEMTRLVVEAVDRGELGQRRCPHGHVDCCGHHDLEDMPVHTEGCP